MITLEPLNGRRTDGPILRVVGVGGCGGNALNTMIEKGLANVDFLAVNTDCQALELSRADVKIQVGNNITKGLGAGADPEIGKKAAEESCEELRKEIAGCDMMFVTAGMGGGTGTGAAPFIAKMGQELGALVVGVVTKPFDYEAKRRINIAKTGIEELRANVDALIVVPNQKILSIIDRNTSAIDAYKKIDEVLYNATRGIADIITSKGLINVDFADVRTVMKGMGDALMGIGFGKGEHRALEAAQNALNSPLLDGVSIQGAKAALVNICGGPEVTMHEIAEAMSVINEATGDDINLIFGHVIDNNMPADEIMVTVVATGFDKIKEDNVRESVNLKQVNPLNTTLQAPNKYGPSIRKVAQLATMESQQPMFNSPLDPAKPRDANTIANIPAFMRANKAAIRMDDTPNVVSPTLETLQSIPQAAQMRTGTDRPTFLRTIMD